ncbi:peroxisome assembly factor 2-like isoform X1 [Dreissena polymorpha]|uniref:peroxisome assembly factor 2-like isoform X1 n=1 Tax=Dreissena polymorpha TaxID=45954 RepID=UPI002264C582|nr:peroxisome assembly factor 2-like isoform X1 [Dreissena polymorpha]
MAALSNSDKFRDKTLRFNASLVKLDKQDLSNNDNQLHVFVSRKDADILGLPSSRQSFCLSIWTNTKSESKHPPGKGSVFQRFLSNSQNFPEILIPDTEETDVDNTGSIVHGSDIEIFVVTIIREQTQNQAETDSPNKIEIFCSPEFMTHYNIASENIYVRCVQLHPVYNLVIGVGSQETYRWITKRDSEFSKHLLQIIKKSPVLVRAKDVFLAPYGPFLNDPDFKREYYTDTFVLECSPVKQGMLTEKTEMVITFLGDMQAETKRFQDKIRSLKRPGNAVSFSPLLSDFTQYSDVFYSNSLQQEDEDDCIPNFEDITDDKNSKTTTQTFDVTRQRKVSDFIGSFCFEVVSQEYVFREMLFREVKKQNFDSFYFIGMSRKQMLKLGVFDSSYVLVTPDYDEDVDVVGKDPPIERLCMVRCLTKEFDRSTKVYISPLCLFNMQQKPPVILPSKLKLKRYNFTDVYTLNIISSKSPSCTVTPPVASEVTISIVPSPNYSPRSPHDEALKQYFTCRRVVAKGDIIAIRSSDDPLFWQNTGDDTENRFPCIYFKVIGIQGQETKHRNFVMDTTHTTLVQIGTEHSYVPVMMQTYLSPQPVSFWDQDYLHGLHTYVDRLENFILPHITTSSETKILQSLPPAILLSGPVGCGKTSLVVAVARRFGVHAFKVNCHTLVGESAAATESRMKNAFTAAGLYSPCILLLQSIHALGRDRDGNTEDPRVASSLLSNVMQLKNDLQLFPMVVVATCHKNKDLTHDMQECFLHHLKIEVPTEHERGDIVGALIQNVNHSANICLSYIAQRTAGFVLGDLAALVAHAKREAFKRIVNLCYSGKVRPTVSEEEDLLAAGIVLQQADFQAALDQLQAAHSDAIGAPKIPNVMWDDVGGLSDVKSEILDTIQLPLQYPELLAAGLRRSGVLLYGPPGTGKTLLAKAVATECSLNFLSVKGPELINMYVGQSEQNIREVFNRARSATPCVIFFDELDSLAPHRGKSGDSGGVMDRVVSQLLAEMDGLNKASDVFVIGATNRPDLLDPALLRPGRFDKMLYLGVSDDNQSQYRILKALTRKFNLEENFDMEKFVEKCPFNLTGADFYALASDAMLNAIKRKIDLVDAGKTVEDKITVGESDFQLALENLSPSVSEAELERYEHIREQLKGGHSGDDTVQDSVERLKEIAARYTDGTEDGKYDAEGMEEEIIDKQADILNAQSAEL